MKGVSLDEGANPPPPQSCCWDGAAMPRLHGGERFDRLKASWVEGQAITGEFSNPFGYQLRAAA